MKSRFSGRRIDGRTFLKEALRGERNFTDADLTGCDLAAYPRPVERFNQEMIDRCVPYDDPAYPAMVRGDWLDLDPGTLSETLRRNSRALRAERFYFTQANMSGFCAIGMFLPLADLRYTYLDSADLTECFLARSQLDESEAPGLQLENADLRWSSFNGARFVGANLSGSLFGGASLVQTSLASSLLCGADLSRTVFEHTDMSSCDLSGASLVDAEGLSTATWADARFTRTRARREDIQMIRRKRELDGLDRTTPQQRTVRKGR